MNIICFCMGHKLFFTKGMYYICTCSRCGDEIFDWEKHRKSDCLGDCPVHNPKKQSNPMTNGYVKPDKTGVNIND